MAQVSALALAALSVGALAAVGGGVGYAAKNAEPGDTLYPLHVKLYADSDIETEAGAEVEALGDIVLRAKKFHADGQLNAEARAELEHDASMHVDTIEKVIVRLEADGRQEEATRIRMALEAALNNVNAALKAESESSVKVDADSSMSSGYSSASTDSDSHVDVNVNAEAESTVRVNQN